MATRLPKVFPKHRRAIVRLRIDFTKPLAQRPSPPTLTGPALVKITQRAPAGGWSDVTDQFGLSNEDVSSPYVAFTLGAGVAAAGEQPATQDGGDYTIRVECPASTGERLVSTHALTVHDTGDEEAPSG